MMPLKRYLVRVENRRESKCWNAHGIFPNIWVTIIHQEVRGSTSLIGCKTLFRDAVSVKKISQSSLQVYGIFYLVEGSTAG